jgi:hypothetical protein
MGGYYVDRRKLDNKSSEQLIVRKKNLVWVQLTPV